MGSREAALSLYRLLMRKGGELALTDKQFYFRRIREEFLKSRDVSSEEEINKLIEKGHAFLKRDALR